MDTERIAAFVAVVEAGSLSRGAERLGARLPTISRQILDLERVLGATLLVRTGRGVRPTPAGERFLERARTILRELEIAAAEVRQDAEIDGSVLRISAPPDLSLRVMPAVLGALVAKHPGLRVDARAESRRVSLLEEGYDAVIRLGSLDDSGLVARRLGGVRRVLCAQPAIARALCAVEELAGVEFVRVHGTGTAADARWCGRAVRVELTGPLTVATFAEAAEIVARDARFVALLPSFAAAPRITRGHLRCALPDLAFPAVDARLVHVRRNRSAGILRDLGDGVAAALDADDAVVAGPAAWG